MRKIYYVKFTGTGRRKQLAEENQLILAEAMTIYHMPLYKELHDRIASGSLGELKMAQMNFGSYKEYDMTNRFFNPSLAGGALLDIGVYAFHFFARILLFPYQEPHILMHVLFDRLK